MAYSRKRSKAHRISRARTAKACGKHMKNECGGRCTWATNVGCRKRSSKRRRSTKRSTKRRRAVSRKRSAPRINRDHTTSVCGRYRKDECPSPQCTWATNIGCRRAMMPVPLSSVVAPSATSSPLISAADANNAAAALGRARSSPVAAPPTPFDYQQFRDEHPDFARADRCLRWDKKDNCKEPCTWLDDVSACVRQPQANDDSVTKKVHVDLMKLIGKDPLQAPAQYLPSLGKF